MAYDKKLTRWSRIVRLRDHFKCYLCEEVLAEGRIMEAHHIKPKRDYPELTYDLNNGITLCKRCHLEIVHTTHKSHKKLYVVFKRYISKVKIKAFNKINQKKVDK